MFRQLGSFYYPSFLYWCGFIRKTVPLGTIFVGSNICKQERPSSASNTLCIWGNTLGRTPARGWFYIHNKFETVVKSIPHAPLQHQCPEAPLQHQCPDCASGDLTRPSPSTFCQVSSQQLWVGDFISSSWRWVPASSSQRGVPALSTSSSPGAPSSGSCC